MKFPCAKDATLAMQPVRWWAIHIHEVDSGMGCASGVSESLKWIKQTQAQRRGSFPVFPRTPFCIFHDVL